MKRKQLGIEGLRREVIKLKAERGILKNRSLLREGTEMSSVSLQGIGESGRRRSCGDAQCLKGWILCMVDTRTQCASAQ